MKTTNATNLFTAIASLFIKKEFMPALIPVKVITNPHFQNR
ncbi:hypothetical protein ACX0G9_17175 [Flavitalea flava]